ncbi:caveolin-3-like [Limulus polyphemus]|uniref:Caveolin n=1 Tax=Limulus polyphemus TaxID=6850 RepID=A0ABM1S4E4_LIMPO|nr:caveolin-3-like [Limulus polyphemus]
MTNTSGPDLDNRDPNTLNEYLQVEFDDVIAEPQGAYSVDCVWKVAYKIFTGTKNCCYKFLTILFAFPIAFAVGCSFAIMSFQHIWCIGQLYVISGLAATSFGCMFAHVLIPVWHPVATTWACFSVEFGSLEALEPKIKFFNCQVNPLPKTRF